MMLQDSADTAVTLSELALDVAGQPNPADMINRVTELAVKIVDCAAADLIRITGSGELRVVASSDPGLSELTEKAWKRWPHTTIAQPPALDNTDILLQRSSYMQQLRSDTGILQELIVPLAAGRSDHGYLRFLFTRARAATASRDLITSFCAHAAIALDRAALLTQVENLRLALDSNRIIGAAIGVLMTRHQISYSEGLRRLKVTSQNLNRRLYDLASDVLYTGELPQDRTRPRSISPTRTGMQ